MSNLLILHLNNLAKVQAENPLILLSPDQQNSQNESKHHFPNLNSKSNVEFYYLQTDIISAIASHISTLFEPIQTSKFTTFTSSYSKTVSTTRPKSIFSTDDCAESFAVSSIISETNTTTLRTSLETAHKEAQIET